MSDLRDWYWLAADGRVFSSRRSALVAADDADYVAWRARGNVATGWPKDGAGQQTDAALAEALAPHGLYTSPAAALAAGAKAECTRRIFAHLSDATQKNITAYAADLALTGTLSSDQQADVATARAIRLWINGPAGMQAACRALIAAGDATYAQDSHWPAWNAAWDAFVARF